MASTTQTPPRRVAMISYHTCPLARLGGQKTGGMNVYVRDFSQALAATGVQVDVFTRLQPGCEPVVNHELGPNCRVIHIPAGPDRLVSLREMECYLDEFAAGVLAFAAAEGAHYDLIHSHYWLSGLIGEQLRTAWGGVPLVQMFHTLGHMKNAIARSPDEQASPQRLAGETRLVHSVDRLIAATPAEEQQLIELVRRRPGQDRHRAAGRGSGPLSAHPPGDCHALHRHPALAQEHPLCRAHRAAQGHRHAAQGPGPAPG